MSHTLNDLSHHFDTYLLNIHRIYLAAAKFIGSVADTLVMSLFEVDDYKPALQVILADRRKTHKGLSRKLAEHLGVHPTMVSQVITGSKDFTEEQMILVCEFFGLAKLESQYLLVILQQARAGSKKLKDYFEEMKLQIRRQALQVSQRVPRDRQLSEIEKSIFYSSWLFSAIHLFTTLDRKVRFDDIYKKFNLPPDRTREILDFLMGLDLVVEKDGLYTSGPVATHLEKKSPFLPKHHANWRLKAIQTAENLSDQELMYSASVSLSKKDFELLREEFMQVIQRFVEVVRPSPSEELAQFNLDFFWIKS
jgi:uncharacterized protein (TIGR02147 family)